MPFATGDYREAGVPPVLLVFNDFAGARAAVRSSSRRPVLVVRSKDDPARLYAIVKCEADAVNDRRSVKLGSAGTILKMAFKGGGKLPPDKDWTIAMSSRQDTGDFWLLTPERDLEPGEYGLWDIDGSGVALFGGD